MSIRKLTVAAVAALGLSLGAHSASAGPVNEGIAPMSSATSQSTFTLIRGGGGGGGGHMGGGGGGMGHMGGGGFGGGGMSHMGGNSAAWEACVPVVRSSVAPDLVAGPPACRDEQGLHGGRAAFYRPGIAGRGIYAGRGFNGGRTALYRGHRGYWRHGRFFPLVGVGLWGWDGDYGYGYGGGSCYWNCRAAGYGPGFCSVNSESFCY